MLAVLGFDSASVPLLDRLMGEGRLPAMSALMARGVRWDLATPSSRYAGLRWTLHSGQPFAEHGLYYGLQWSPAEQRLRPRERFEQPRAVWEALSAAGRRCLVVDPYESAPPRIMSGTYLSGWQFRLGGALRRHSWPAGSGRSLARRMGTPPRTREVHGRPAAAALLALLELLLAAPARVADVVTDLVARARFDLVWATFLSPHVGGHWFLDVSHVDGATGTAKRARLEDALARIYVEVDAAIGRIVAALPRGADVLVVSPIGMGPNRDRSDLLPGMLDRVLSDTGASPDPDDGPGGAIWRLRAAVPARWRAAVAQAMPSALVTEMTARLDVFGADWGRTRAFAPPTDLYGYVRLNLRGRERDGIVAPDEVDGLLERIRRGLLSFRDLDEGPAVAGVERAVDFAGPGRRLGQLPDLFVRWSDPHPGLRGVVSERHGEVRRAGVGSGRSGNHTDDGAWAIIAPGASEPRRDGPAPRVADIPVTAGALLGVEVAGGESLMRPA